MSVALTVLVGVILGIWNVRPRVAVPVILVCGFAFVGLDACCSLPIPGVPHLITPCAPPYIGGRTDVADAGATP